MTHPPPGCLCKKKTNDVEGLAQVTRAEQALLLLKMWLGHERGTRQINSLDQQPQQGDPINPAHHSPLFRSPPPDTPHSIQSKNGS